MPRDVVKAITIGLSAGYILTLFLKVTAFQPDNMGYYCNHKQRIDYIFPAKFVTCYLFEEIQ